jgi:quercetin dioxygenase-like cupin family protein
MRNIPRVLQKEGWHLTGSGMPIQVGVKFGATPFSGKHLHKTMAEYFLLLEGDLRIQVNGKILEMKKGDLVVVEPGEAHDVLYASPEALLFLLMPPSVPDDKVEL